MRSNNCKKILLGACVALTSGVFAQPTFEWAKNISATNVDYMMGCSAVDDFGSAVVFGGFTGPIAFGSITFTNSGSLDGYICKYAADGSVAWAKKLGTVGTDYIRQVKSDQEGNIYALCDFDGPITIGTTLLNLTSRDVVLIKYNPAGDVIWVKKFGNTGVDAGRGMDVSTQGNIVISGIFNSPTIDFGGTVLTNSNSVETSYNNMFIVSLDANGDTQWARRGSGENTVSVKQNVIIDSSGNAYVFGNYGCYDLTFESTTLTNSSNPQGAFFYPDMFLVKYSASGIFQWAKSYGGEVRETADSIAFDASGNVMISGYFDSPTITFASLTVNRQVNGSIFLAKVNSDGAMAWAQNAGYYGVTAKGSVSDAQGNIYLSGIYQGSVHFGNIIVNSPNTSPAVVYITKYDTDGVAKWVKATTPATDVNTDVGIAINGLGDLYVCARYSNPTVTFDGTILTNTGTGNAFLAKINHESLATPAFNQEIVSLYPNPVKNTLYLQNLPETEMPIVIYDMAGREAMRTASVSNTVEVSNLSRGIYLLKSGNITIKFIKE